MRKMKKLKNMSIVKERIAITLDKNTLIELNNLCEQYSFSKSNMVKILINKYKINK